VKAHGAAVKEFDSPIAPDPAAIPNMANRNVLAFVLLLGFKRFNPRSFGTTQNRKTKNVKANDRKITGSNLWTNSSISSVSMLFIVSSDDKKADPATRKLIRSHAMQGIKKKRRRFVGPVMLDEESEKGTPALPCRVGSDLSFLNFADEIEPSIAWNIVKG